MHEADIYCVGKGKDHKAYEYGRKASVVTTEKSQIIVGVASHDEHVHDSKTLKPAIEAANRNRQTPKPQQWLIEDIVAAKEKLKSK